MQIKVQLLVVDVIFARHIVINIKIFLHFLNNVSATGLFLYLSISTWLRLYSRVKKRQCKSGFVGSRISSRMSNWTVLHIKYPLHWLICICFFFFNFLAFTCPCGSKHISENSKQCRCKSGFAGSSFLLYKVYQNQTISMQIMVFANNLFSVPWLFCILSFFYLTSLPMPTWLKVYSRTQTMSMQIRLCWWQMWANLQIAI